MLKFCTWSNLLLRFLKSFTQVTWMVCNNPYRRSTNSSALQSFPLALDVWLSPRASLFCVNRSIALVDMSITVESWWTSTQDLCGRNRSNSSERKSHSLFGTKCCGSNLKVLHYLHFEYEIVIYVFTGFYPIHCISKNSIDNVFLGLLFRPDWLPNWKLSLIGMLKWT